MPTALEEVRTTIKDRGWRLYFDTSPLFHPEWTGIPNVAAGLAQALVDLIDDDTQFFYRRYLVSRGAVLDALQRRSGLYLIRDFAQGHANAGPIPVACSHERTIGFFPSVKLVADQFRVECSLYHDISTFLLPQYHTPENIQHHLHGLRTDINTNLVTFAVSQATVDDLICYLGAPPDATFVAQNGVSWPWWFSIEAENCGRPYHEPYFVVLGTREPRKNLSIVWRMLEMFPEVAERCRIVLIGRHGWLVDEQEKSPRMQRLLASGRVVLTGYVSEFEKYRLLCFAKASLYPSLFEGFGLPILESLSVGTACIASWSSAMPEVGGDACLYFDPLSVEDLAANVLRVLDGQVGTGQSFDVAALTERFCWPEMLRGILGHILAALPPEVTRQGLRPPIPTPAVDPLPGRKRLSEARRRR